MRILFLTFFLLSFPEFSQAQIRAYDFEIRNIDKFSNKISASKINAPLPTESQNMFDVIHYDIDLAFNLPELLFEGSIGITFISADDGLSKVDFNALDLFIKSIREANGDTLTWEYNKSSDIVSINLNENLLRDEQLSIEIEYWGNALSLYLVFSDKHLTFSKIENDYMIYSYSQPWGARSWYVCKDYPDDKATFDIYYSVPDDLTAVSNGRFLGYTEEIKWDKPYRKYHWQENYPMSTYNLMIAAYRYEKITDFWEYAPGDTMPVTHYVYPSNLEKAKTDFEITVPVLDYFSEIFGIYPFTEDKYGYVLWNRGGALEHQTLTSLTDRIITGEHKYDNTRVHELAHEWFGNCISCENWKDIWLNEGFADYAYILWSEHIKGYEWTKTFMERIKGFKDWWEGPVLRDEQSEDPRYFFNQVVYDKGAAILFMLRHITGDDVFFKILKNYANNPLFRYKSVTTQDFIDVCEKEYGKPLDWFFNPWLTRTDYPEYNYSWNTTGDENGLGLTFLVEQINAEPYKMPVDFRIITSTGQIDTLLWIEDTKEVFHFNLSEDVLNIELDPDNRILCDKRKIEFTNVENNDNILFELSQNTPNPFNPVTTMSYTLPKSGHVTLNVYSVSGQKIASLVDGFIDAGKHEVIFDGSGLASGVYLYRCEANGFSKSGRMLLMK